MIAYLKGVLVAHDGSRAILDVRDVGYEVHGPPSDVAAWAADGGPVSVFVSTDVKEDAITLYGFSRDLDRVAFERLRLVKGVGPKVALAALDALGLDGLVEAVATGDTKKLASIPGVGTRLAQRLALELEGKLPVGFTPAARPAPGPAPGAPDTFALAMARLGYTRTEIQRARERLVVDGLGEDAPIAERITAALAILSGAQGA